MKEEQTLQYTEALSDFSELGILTILIILTGENIRRARRRRRAKGKQILQHYLYFVFCLF